ncbi:MAG: nuclear transport factor 2 family protein [Actinomycetia bacterium]|nr:nuclear transport factor 2 family protein [Actinomycetes bacterium]
MGFNEQIVQEAYAAFGQGDIKSVLDLLTDDVEWHSPRTLPHGGVFHGKADVGRFFEGLADAWDSLDLTIETVSEIGPESVVGVLRADGVRQNKQAGGYGAVHVFTVRDGSISRFREYTDVDVALA